MRSSVPVTVVLWLVFALVTLILILELLEFVLEVVMGPTSTLLAFVVLSLVSYALVTGSGGRPQPFCSGPAHRRACDRTAPNSRSRTS